jgi:hypothetical protein
MNVKKMFVLIAQACISSAVYVIASAYVPAPTIAMAAPGPVVPMPVVPGPVVPVAVVPGSAGGSPPPGAAVVPPPIVLPEPPHIISGPSIGVDVVVGVPYDLVVVNGLFYRHWNGLWFRSGSYDGIWIGISGGLIPGVIRADRWDGIRQFRDREYANYRRDPQHYRGSVRTASPGHGASGGKNASSHNASGRSARGGSASGRSVSGHSASRRSSRGGGRSASGRSSMGRGSMGRGSMGRGSMGRGSMGRGTARGRTARVRK